MLRVFLFFIFILSCNDSIKLSKSESIDTPFEVVQNELTPVDNIDLNSNSFISSVGLNSSSAYIIVNFTLSNSAGNPVISIAGKYDDALSLADISNLSSIGLTNASAASTKGNILGLSKNISSSTSLAFNIKINASIYSSSNFSEFVGNVPEATIFVGGDNHYDGEFLTPINGENYYIFHEWGDTQFSAIELLPEGNYRKIKLTDSPEDRIDEIEFDPTLSLVNGHEVGYSYSRSSLSTYKVTNDGSGLTGWNFTSMGANFSQDYWFTTGLGQVNSESVLLASNRFGPRFEDDAITIITWDGTSWIEDEVGNEFLLSMGSPWVGENSIASRPFKSDDGSFWFTVQEYTSRSEGDRTTLVTKEGHLVRMQYNSGSYTDPSNWTFDVVSFPMDSKTASVYAPYATYISSYTDINNFTAYYNADGIGKVSVESGTVSYSVVATSGGSASYDTEEEFPTGLFDVDGIQRVQPTVDIVLDKSDSNKLIFQGYTSIINLDLTTDIITELLGKVDGASTSYSR